MALTLGGIIGACGLFCGFLSWVLMCPGHPRDPKEDMEQMRYLSEQIFTSSRGSFPAGCTF